LFIMLMISRSILSELPGRLTITYILEIAALLIPIGIGYIEM